MPFLPDEFIERVADANKIYDVASEYATLKRAGQVYTSLCPFHNEKTPSCRYYPDTNSFYCFGCHKGGSVIKFIELIENLTFVEAVNFLAQKKGIELPEEARRGDKQTIKKRRLLEMNKAAARYFYANLKTEKGQKGVKYLLDRGLKPETINKFGLGVAIDSWNGLKYALMSQGFSESELIEGGLLTVSGKSKSSFDFFMNRAMFPFFDLNGNVIGFSGRTLGDDKRKYLNSKESDVFKKSQTLFCLNYAKSLSTKSKKLILCEGNMDVISLHQAGFNNAVATCGTALTEQHANLMDHYCDEVIICYDSDDAGKAAAIKAYNILQQYGLKSRIITMVGAKDPDEYIRKFGVPAFEHLLQNAPDSIDYMLERCADGLDLESNAGVIEYTQKAIKIVAAIENEISRYTYMSAIAKKSGISLEVIKAQTQDLIDKKHRVQVKRETKEMNTFAERRSLPPEEAQHPRETKAQRGLLIYLYLNPDKAQAISEELSPDKFLSPAYKNIYTALLKKSKNAEEYSISSFHNELTSEEMDKISEIMALSKELVETEQTAWDYVSVLNSYTPQDDSELSDDDLLSFREQLRNKKG